MVSAELGTAATETVEVRGADDEEERPEGRLGPRAVTLAFGLVVAASAAYLVRITADSWFWADEWLMARQVERTQGVFDPYNGHLSVTILSLYKLLLEVFGFSTHLPYRIAGVASLVAVPVAMFLVARRGVGPPLAAVMGLVLLLFRQLSFEPGGLNHSLALVGGIVCAGALVERGPRADLVVGVSLAFALASTGGGTAVVAAAVVHSLCTRAARRRWLAVLVPSAAWFAWWVALVPPDPPSVTDLRPGLPELIEGAVRHAAESFRYLALGNRALGVVLLCLFLVHAGWRVRQGLAAAANVLAWSVALLVWWFGLMWSRWFTLDDPAFRYVFVSVALVLLAVLPPQVPALPSWMRASTRREAAVAVTGVLLVAGGLALAVRPDAQEFARGSAAIGRNTRAQVALATHPDATVPADATLGFAAGELTAAELRAVLDAYGGHDDAADLDELLVGLRVVSVSPGRSDPAPRRCDDDLGGPVPVGPAQRVQVYSRTGTAPVEVRRFGRDWLPVGRVAEGQRATLYLPLYQAAEPWQVRGDGLCVIAPRA